MTGNVAGFRLFMIMSATICTLAPQSIWADTILFERDLPNASNGGVGYVNNSAQADTSCQPTYPNCRANTSWLSGFSSSGTYFLAGDSFALSTSAAINTITVYEVANNPVTNLNASLPTNEFSSLALYVGPETGTLSLASTNFTSTQVGYAPGVNYQGSSGTFFPIYAISFTLPGTVFAAGTDYGFAVDATPNTSNPAYCNSTPGCYGLFLSAANAGLSVLSGAIEQGADDNFIYYGEPSQGSQAPSFASGGLCNSGDPSCGGWDKSSDLNVTISGDIIGTTPEPGTLGVMSLAMLGGLALRRRCLVK